MKGRNWFWGIFFILATILLIAGGLGAFAAFSFWSLLGIIILVAIIIQSSIYRVFAGIFVPISLIYLIFQGPLGWPYLSPWILVIAAILLSIGFHILFRGRPKKYHAHDGKWGHFENRESQVSENGDENNPDISVKFGSTVRYLRATALASGRFAASFGNLDVYFDQVQVAPGGAEIFLDCNFGAIKLYVPRTWRVENRTRASIGGVDFKNGGQSAPDAPLLILTGNISMAGVEVQYI